MADIRDLSPTEQAVAQSAARSAIQKWQSKAKEMLASRNHGLVLVAEDLGGLVVGGGLDLLSRAAFYKWLAKKPDESDLDHLTRWERWTSGLSIVLGGAGWVGTVVASHGDMQIHPIKQGLRNASSAQVLLGANRLISSALKLPA